MAVEKAFKVVAQQNGEKLVGHDLDILADKVKTYGLNVAQAQLQVLPHWKTSINNRYSEKTVEISDAFDIYTAALFLLDEITAKLKREISINNGALLLKKPKWVGR